MNYFTSKSRPRVAVVWLLAFSLTGCAISTQQVADEASRRTSVITTAQQQLQAQAKPPEALRRIPGNYIGGQATVISQSVALPASAREAVLNFKGYGSLQQVIRNIRDSTGIPVRINADVVEPTRAAAEPVPAPATQPGGPLPVSLRVAPRSAGDFPLGFSGDLGDYLNNIAGILGASWEYANGEIHIFRKTTRVFSLMVSSGSQEVRDDINTSGQSSGGGAAQTQQAGTFGSNSNATTKSDYDPWKLIDQVLKTMVSSEGKYTVNQASGTIVVSDVKQHVDRIAEWVRQENATLTRQVAIEVREIAVDLRTDSQIGVDLNLVYQQLNRASGAQDWVFRFGAPSSVVDASAGSVGFNVARPDARLSGTNVALQALNSLGNIVHDSTRTVLTTNRVPGRVQDVTDRAYLAETTPAGGGTSPGTTGVPGLRPGIVTYGDNLIIVPTIGESNMVLLQLFSTRSSLLELNSVTAGQGITFQQINTPVLGRQKNSQNFHVQQGETLVIVGNTSDRWSSKDNHSITGGSRSATQQRTLNVLLVTPRVMAGS
ncbi:MAG: hypothetical protein HYX47_13345 [Burkholderiales bacterium]|nr:hypothetical protein [Burkholderiales bacterium]